MNTVFWAGVAFATLATSTLAIAAQTMSAPPAPPSHELTFAEFQADAAKVWDRLDANHDGKIGGADRDARLLERFAQWDTNHDGMVSKDEFLAHVHAREAEWKAHDHPGPDGGHGHDGFGMDGRMGRHGGGQDHTDHPHGRMMAMAIIGPVMHDARNGGVITRVAFDAAIKARFDKIDTNHDGKLSHEEMRAVRRQHGDGQHHYGHGPHHGDWGHDHGDMPQPPFPAGQ